MMFLIIHMYTFQAIITSLEEGKMVVRLHPTKDFQLGVAGAESALHVQYFLPSQIEQRNIKRIISIAAI